MTTFLLTAIMGVYALISGISMIVNKGNDKISKQNMAKYTEESVRKAAPKQGAVLLLVGVLCLFYSAGRNGFLPAEMWAGIETVSLVLLIGSLGLLLATYLLMKKK